MESSNDFYDWLRNTKNEISEFYPGNPIFRGMGPSLDDDPEYDFDLVPKIARKKYLNYIHKEYSVFMYFKEFAGKRIEGLSGWEILTLMRHHNIPTRLLDWTQSLEIAIYFAIVDLNKDQDVVIWVLNPAKLNSENGMGSAPFNSFDRINITEEIKRNDPLNIIENLNILDEYQKFANYQSLKAENLKKTSTDNSEMLKKLMESSISQIDSTNKKDAIFVVPSRKHPRITAQKSFFTLHYNLNPLNKLPNNEKFLLRLVLPKDLILEARVFLRLNNINEYSLFPDLSGLGEEILSGYFFEKNYWKKV